MINVGGQVVDCKLVRGFSEPELASAGRVKRTLCIDVSRDFIVWEKSETKYNSRTFTYSKIERDADAPADTFVFTPPPQSRQTPYELPVPRPLGSRSMPFDPDVTLPKLLSKRDPVCDEESRKARMEGTVVLYVVIDPQGVPAEIEVFRPLSPKLDQAAVDSVGQWRFAAATKQGQPVAVATLIEVNFKLLLNH